jgi:hypothetical protein
MTDHAPRNDNRNRLWIGFTILVVCAAVIFGWWFVQKREPLVPVSKPAFEDSKTTTVVEAGSAKASPANGSKPRTTHRTDAASEKSPAAAIAPRATAAITPRDTSRDQPIPTRPPVSLPDDEEVVDEEVLPDHPLLEMWGNLPRPIKPAAAPEAAKIQSVSLQEAISKMTLSLLMYSDNKAESMVYINGKKYGEGDYIDGIYLLESITGDGAIISHQGEHTLLQPKPK